MRTSAGTVPVAGCGSHRLAAATVRRSVQADAWNGTSFAAEATGGLVRSSWNAGAAAGVAIPVPSRPVALLVFLSAAAGAGIVAADFVVGPVDGLGRSGFFAAVECSHRRESLQRKKDNLALPFFAAADFGNQQQVLDGLAYGVCL